MPLLAIETATKQLGVAVVEGETLLASYQVLADYPHAVELPGAVSRVLKEAGTSFKALDGIAVDVGPGSFTGLRIGVAFAKALAFVAKKPLVGIASLDILAAGVPYSPHPVCAFLDARRGNAYMAMYRIERDLPMRMTPEYLLVPASEALSQTQGPTVFVGDGCARYREQILARLGDDARIAPHAWWLPSAAVLARLGWQQLQVGRSDDPATLVPRYLYRQDCGINPSARLPGAPRKAKPTAVTP